MGYTHLNRNDPAIETWHGVFAKIRRALGTTAVGINEVRMPPGFEGVRHDEAETGHEEVYLVLSGSGTATIDGESLPLVEGDYLRVDPASTRLVTAGDEGLTFVVVGARPQPAYDGRASL